MKRFVHKLAARRYPNEKPPYNESARAALGSLEGWVSIVSNTLLACVKVALSLLSGSLSLMADAVHTFADSLTSLVVIVGFRMAGKPADEKHPFGHARIESIATLIIGVLLAVAAVELGRGAVERLLAPQPVEAPVWMIVAVILMAAAKEVMARFSFELGRLICSGALEADAWHHRSDVFATLLVAGAFIASRFGLYWLDGAAGIGVSFIVAWAAYHIIAEAAHPLIGEKLSAEEVSRITKLALTVDGARGVHDIVVQRFGSFQVMSLHVVVSRELNVVAAHDISHAVETLLDQTFGAHATVHIDPIGADHPVTPRIRAVIAAAIAGMDGLRGNHDLRVTAQADGFLTVTFDLNTDKEISAQMRETYRNALSEKICDLFPGTRVDAQFDPPFCLAADEQ